MTSVGVFMTVNFRTFKALRTFSSAYYSVKITWTFSYKTFTDICLTPPITYKDFLILFAHEVQRMPLT